MEAEKDNAGWIGKVPFIRFKGVYIEVREVAEMTQVLIHVDPTAKVEIAHFPYDIREENYT